MSFLDNFSKWRKLDKKNQRGNHTKMDFAMVNRKIRKTDHGDIHLFYH